ncbi:MAG: VOC family protein [Balneolaceae bacterium]|nr:VOC family protein [Balneolaceae bacterium]
MITAYLTFNGNTEEVFNFYQSVLGGELINLQRYGDTPQAGQLSREDHQKIMHITLSGPNGTLLMGNDHMDFMGEPFTPGNNFALSLHPDSEQKARKLFEDLSEGGNISVPFDKAPWGAFFGMFTDKFGIKWMINYQQNA